MERREKPGKLCAQKVSPDPCVWGAVVGSCQHRASLEQGATGSRGMGEFGSFPVEATKGAA